MIRMVSRYVRPFPMLLFLLTLLVASEASGGLSLRLIFAVLGVEASWLGCVAVNEYYDAREDAVNRAAYARPGRGVLWKASTLLGLALVASLLAGPLPFLILGALIAVGIAYSHPAVRLKGKAPWVNATLGVVMFLVFLEGASVGGQIGVRVVLAAALLGYCAAVVSVVKDFKDVEGDLEAGIKTLPAELGRRKGAKYLAISSTHIYVLVSLLLFMTGLIGPVGLVADLLVAVPLNVLVFHRYIKDLGCEGADLVLYRNAFLPFLVLLLSLLTG